MTKVSFIGWPVDCTHLVSFAVSEWKTTSAAWPVLSNVEQGTQTNEFLSVVLLLKKLKFEFVRKLGNHGHWKCPKTSLIFYPLMTNQKKTEPELSQPHDWPQMRSTKVTFHEFKKAPRHLAHPALLSFLSSDWMMGCASYNSMKLSDESGEVFENGASEFWGSNRGSRCGPCIVTPLHVLLLTAF